jgi:hypothetical protein
MLSFRKIALGLGTLCLSAASLSAGTVTYNYSFSGVKNSGSSNLGNSWAFSPVGYSSPTITAFGYSGLGGHINAAALYSNGSAYDFSNPANDSGKGLGMAGNSNHQLSGNDFIVLDLGNLSGLSITTLDVYFQGLTNGEKWAIWGSNTGPGSSVYEPGSGVMTGGSDGIQNISGFEGDRYLYIAADCGSILVGGLTVVDPHSAVPEPSSTAALGISLLGGGLLLRRWKLARK